MRIKKHHTKNEYINTADGFWVRNLCKEGVKPTDINSYSNDEDKRILLKNEFENTKNRLSSLEDININYPNIVIVSDGLDFETKHRILSKMPKAAILGVNGSLAKWKLHGEQCPKEERRSMFYIVNNPYEECMRYIPEHDFYPICMSSIKTNSSFIQKYSKKLKDNVFRYIPTPEEKFAGPSSKNSDVFIDDYRNVICAAIGLAYRFGVRKLMLLCCDDAFKKERPSAIETSKDTYVYPHQMISNNLIDANLFWLKRQNPKIKIADFSLGPHYNYATYIESEREAMEFFNEGDK